MAHKIAPLCVRADGNYVTDSDVTTIVARGAAIAHCPLSNVFFAGCVFPLRRLLDAGVRIGLGTDIAGGASPSLLENARMAMLLSVQVGVACVAFHMCLTGVYSQAANLQAEAGLHPHVPAELRRTPGARIDPPMALWLATAAAAEALDLPVRLGAFRKGYRFDAVAFAGRRQGSNLRLHIRTAGGESSAETSASASGGTGASGHAQAAASLPPDSPIDQLQKILYHATRDDILAVWVDGRCVSGSSHARH